MSYMFWYAFGQVCVEQAFYGTALALSDLCDHLVIWPF